MALKPGVPQCGRNWMNHVTTHWTPEGLATRGKVSRTRTLTAVWVSNLMSLRQRPSLAAVVCQWDAFCLDSSVEGSSRGSGHSGVGKQGTTLWCSCRVTNSLPECEQDLQFASNQQNVAKALDASFMITLWYMAKVTGCHAQDYVTLWDCSCQPSLSLSLWPWRSKVTCVNCLRQGPRGREWQMTSCGWGKPLFYSSKRLKANFFPVESSNGKAGWLTPYLQPVRPSRGLH